MTEQEKRMITEVIEGIKQLTLIAVNEIGDSCGNVDRRYSRLIWVMDIARDTIEDLEDIRKGVKKEERFILGKEQNNGNKN